MSFPQFLSAVLSTGYGDARLNFVWIKQGLAFMFCLRLTPGSV
jgi:hypothetical protein